LAWHSVFVVAEDLIVGPGIEVGERIDPAQEIFDLIGQNTPTSICREALQAFLKSLLDCLGQRLSGFIGNLPG
jgi:hypothetical protein